MIAVLCGTAGTAYADGPDDTWYAPPSSVEVSQPPVGPWPEGGTFTVFLCGDDSPFDRCREKVITPKQKRALEAKLRAMPQVTKVRFEPRKEVGETAVKEFAHDRAVPAGLRTGDVAQAFTGTLRRRADIAPFTSALRKVAGVGDVATRGGSFWAGKADVVIRLCGPGDEPSDTCDGNDPATFRDRERIEARLGTVEGVEKVYFADVEHARRTATFTAVSRDFRSAQFSESYYVRVADRRDAETLIDTIKVFPGVGDAGLVGSG